MLPLRRAVFAVFALIYLVVCPYIILYALGYLVKPGSPNARLVKTGLISVSTVPQGATVYLGNRRYTHKTPTVLRDLMPGKYDVRVSLKNHLLWSRTIDVKPERAAVLDQLLLVPENWSEHALSQDAVEDFTPLPGEDLLLVQRGTRLGGLSILDAKSRKERLLETPSQLLANARVLDTTVVRGSPFVLIRVQVPDRERLLWVDARQRREPAVTDITRMFMAKPQRVAWDPGDTKHLFMLRGGKISRIDLETQTVAPDVVENVRGFTVHGKRLIVAQEDGSVMRMDLEQKTAELLHRDDAVARLLAEATGRMLISPVDSDLLLFATGQGQLIANLFPYVLVDGGLSGLGAITRNDRPVLVWTRNRLGILDPSVTVGAEQPASLRDVRWIDLGATHIEHAWWVHEGRNALVQDGDWVRLVRIYPGQAPEVTDVVRVRTATNAWYAEDPGVLFFLRPEDSRLVALEIAPRWEIPGLARREK